MIRAVRLFSCALLAFQGSEASSVPTQALHQVVEVNLNGEALASWVQDTSANPFVLNITLAATHQDTGDTRVVGGFYDGNFTWRARFACSLVGVWDWEVFADDTVVHNTLATTGSVQCIEPDADTSDHGGLLVDADHPHHFVWADGTRFFPLGYECDWCYAFGMDGASNLTTLGAFLDSLQSGGFNFVTLNFYANHSSWDDAPKDYLMHTTRTPWASADQMTLDTAYFQNYDTVLNTMKSRGIVAHIMIMVENKAVQWPKQQSPADDLYWTTIVNRYQAYDNVVWDVSKEAHRYDPSYWATRLAIIDAKDTHHRLRTIHTSASKQNFVPLEQSECDFIAHQQHSNYHDHILETRAVYPKKPIFNIEYLYEMGALQTYGPQSQAAPVRRTTWEILMGGGYANYYVSTAAWDVVVPGDVVPGYAYCRHAIAFFTSARYWLLDPADAIIQHNSSSAYALSNPDGTEVLVYLEAAGTGGVELALPNSTTGSDWTVTWFDPQSGQQQQDTRGQTVNGSTFIPDPKRYGTTDDVALHLVRA